MPVIKNLLTFLLLGLSALLVTHQAAQAANPIITTAYSADPSAHVFGNRLYVYPSHDRNDAQEYDMTDYHAYSTDDMANWQDHGVILSLDTIPWAKAHLWAPDCGYKNGLYYLYFPADATGHYDFKIGVAASHSPAGPFVAEPQPIPGVSGIDPSIFIDDDGKPYLIWAGGGPVLCKLKPDMKTLDGTPIHLQGCDKFFEGPWIFKRNGLYYLTYAAFQKGGSGEGGSGQNYDYATARAIGGPYTYKGSFTQSGPGAGNIHGSQVAWHGQWYCFYHDCFFSYGKPGSGFKRSVRVDQIHFNPDGSLAPLQWTVTGPPPIKTLDPFVRGEAVCLCQSAPPEDAQAVQTEVCREGGMDLGSISDGSWVKYANADFGPGAKFFSARVATPAEGSRIELHLDHRDGPVIGVCPITSTGGWQTWQTITCPVTGAAGVHDIFFVFRGSPSGGLLNFHWFQFARAAPPVALTVDTAHVLRRDADHFIGIDLNYIRDADANRPQARPLNTALKEMGVRWLRFPGGGKSDFMLWAQPPYAKPEPVSLGWYGTVAGTRLNFDQYLACCRAVGAEPYVVVGYSPEKASGRTQAQWLENAVSWVRYAKSSHSGVKYWEIGNENWNSGKGTPEELAQVVTQFSRAMKAVDPSIKIGASGNGDGWWAKFLPLASPSLDFLSLSLYNCWDWKGYAHFIQHPGEDTIGEAETALRAIDRYAQPADRARLRVVVAETNSKDYSQGGWDGANTLGHALVTWDTLGRLMAQPRILTAMVWTTRWMNDAEAQNSQWYALDADNGLRPTGRALALWGQFVQPEMVAVTGGSDAVSAFAARSANGRAMTVWVLNRGLDAVPDVQIVLPAAAPYHSAALFRLSGTGPDDPNPQWGRVGMLPVSDHAIQNLACPGVSVSILSFSILSLTPHKETLP